MTYNEWKDIFGFDKEVRPEKKKPIESQPVDSFDIDEITKFLAMHPIGELQPRVPFVNEVIWGFGPEAVRVIINNWLNVVIERYVTDLSGLGRWITKKVYQLNHKQMGGTEDAVAHEILQEAERIYRQQPDSPKKEYKEFENLVISTAAMIRRTAHDIFLFGGVRRINENNYIIRLNLRGQGVQRKGQKRVEENHTQMTFDPETGMIRITNYSIESRLRQHEWQVTPTDVDWYFTPTQSKDEISQAIATTLHWY